MAEHTTETSMVSDLVSSDLDTIEPNETVRAAQRRMEAQTLRSLIVTENGNPVGVVKWRGLRQANADDMVSAHMETVFPVLRSNMLMADASLEIGDVDFDNIPVVDENGALVGEIPRSSLMQTEGSAMPVDAVQADDNPVLMSLELGQTVVDADGSKLGTLDELIHDTATSRVMQIVVEHGLFRKKHKRVPADTIQAINDGDVVLGITKTEWDFLPEDEDDEV